MAERLVEYIREAVGKSIRRVAEYEIEALPRRAVEEAERVGPHHLGPVAEAEVVHVSLGQARDRVHERRRGRPARERLDPERAGAAVEVEHPRAANVAEDREDRLAHPLGRRAHLVAAPRAREPASAQLAAADPQLHAARRDLRDALVAEAAARLVHQRAERRAPRASRAARAVASTAARASSSSGGVVGQQRGAESRQPVLAGAEELALAADRRGRPRRA